MAACRECAESIAPEDRFCAHCGAGVAGTDRGVLGLEPVADEPSTVSRDGPARGWFALVAVIVVGLVWMLSRPSDDSASPPLGDSTPDRQTDGFSRDEQDTADGESDEQHDRDHAETESIGTGPAFGREVGWSLWLRGINGLQRIDLDTQNVTEFDVRDRSPIYADDDWLVLAAVADSRSTVAAVPIDDPDAEAVNLGDGSYWPLSITAGPERGTVWMINVEPAEEQAWHLIRLADGDVVEKLPAEALFFLSSQVGPVVVSASDGGIFEWRAGDYRRVADGVLLAVGDDLVLARTCETPTNCDSHWLDRSTWNRVDRDLPDDFRGDGYWTWLSPRGRILIEQSATRLEVFDLVNGSKVDLTVDLWDPTRIAVSPDERYVAVVSGQPIIRDLETDEIYRLAVPVGDEWVLFVADN
ncbi:MAG: hypothetical protein ACR2QO_27730 [Acidimicrobiales bacterium]